MAPRSTFLQDFVTVDRPFERVIAVASGALRESLLAAMVCDAWASQSEALGASGENVFERRDVNVDVDAPRARSASMIVPVRWSRDVGRTLLVADLEFVRFGAERTHLVLSGRASPHVTGSARPSAADRLLVAVVRHFLVAVAVVLTAATDETVSTRVVGNEARVDDTHGLARSGPAGA